MRAPSAGTIQRSTLEYGRTGSTLVKQPAHVNTMQMSVMRGLIPQYTPKKRKPAPAGRFVTALAIAIVHRESQDHLSSDVHDTGRTVNERPCHVIGDTANGRVRVTAHEL